MKEVLLVVLASAVLLGGWMFVTGQRRAAQPPEAGFLFETLEVRGVTYDYAVYVPRGSAGDRLGAIMFLHGRGECGTDGSLQLTVGLPLEIARHPERWPFVVVIPQKPSEDDEWEDHVAAVHAMLDRAIERYGVDPDRVQLTGLSQGGHGAWALGARDPERWASVVPVCGYLAPPEGGWEAFEHDSAWPEDALGRHAQELAGALSGVPVRAYHGALDPVIPARHSEVAVEALRAAGGRAELSVYEDVGHDAWSRAYADPALAAWLREQRRGD